jgi:hypothetical protein
MKIDTEFESWKQQWQNTPDAGITATIGDMKRLRRTAGKQAFRRWLLVIIVSILPLLLACAAIPLVLHLHRNEIAAYFACITALLLPAGLWAAVIRQNRHQLTLSATSFVEGSLRRSQTNLRIAWLGVCVSAGALLFCIVWTFRSLGQQNMLSLSDVPTFLALGLAAMLFAGLAVFQKRAKADAGYLKKLRRDWNEGLDDIDLEAALDPMKSDTDERQIGNPLSRAARSLYLAVVESIRPNGRRHFGKRRNKNRRLS